MVLNVSHSPQYYCFFLKTCFCLLSSGAETTQYQSWESRLCFNTFKLEQGFSVSALLTFVLDNYLLWGLSYASENVKQDPGLQSPDASSTHHLPDVTTKPVSRHCQLSPQGLNRPQLEPQPSLDGTMAVSPGSF